MVRAISEIIALVVIYFIGSFLGIEMGDATLYFADTCNLGEK
jgi:hypothetical protein